MSGDRQSRVRNVWAAAGSMAKLDVVAAIDAPVAQQTQDDAAAAFEAASERDYAGLEAAAEPLSRRAVWLGLDAPTSPRAVTQLASTLRNLGQIDESTRVLEPQSHWQP